MNIGLIFAYGFEAYVEMRGPEYYREEYSPEVLLYEEEKMKWRTFISKMILNILLLKLDVYYSLSVSLTLHQ